MDYQLRAEIIAEAKERRVEFAERAKANYADNYFLLAKEGDTDLGGQGVLAYYLMSAAAEAEALGAGDHPYPAEMSGFIPMALRRIGVVSAEEHTDVDLFLDDDGAYHEYTLLQKYCEKYQLVSLPDRQPPVFTGDDEEDIEAVRFHQAFRKAVYQLDK